VGLLVNAEGTVAPCCLNADAPAFGDLTKEPLETIWNNELYVESRKAVADPEYSPKVPTPCEGCTLYL
jgi:radical SAM protein with 4Fe4S-binding SPASM domain